MPTFQYSFISNLRLRIVVCKARSKDQWYYILETKLLYKKLFFYSSTRSSKSLSVAHVRLLFIVNPVQLIRTAQQVQT